MTEKIVGTLWGRVGDDPFCTTEIGRTFVSLRKQLLEPELLNNAEPEEDLSRLHYLVRQAEDKIRYNVSQVEDCLIDLHNLKAEDRSPICREIVDTLERSLRNVTQAGDPTD